MGPCRDAGGALHPLTITNHNALRHYIVHQASVARPNFAALDIGAYEFSPLEAWRYQISYTVQVSGNLTNWFDGCAYTDAGDLLTNAYTTDVSPPGTNTVTVRLNQMLPAAFQGFLRVLVER